MYCRGCWKCLEEEVEDEKGRYYRQCTQWFRDSHMGSRSWPLIDQSLEGRYAYEEVVMAVGIPLLPPHRSSFSSYPLILKKHTIYLTIVYSKVCRRVK